ncbi:hypothetical protein BDDG_13716 [Blastomyces dermatitidis ATCC 18188]|uniref:Uncharacterized protein n=1 Tax=Ajellomyces dermatitidis (strain ATCC 18188 / CBS 674.68) TaxID=653446 RepID=A0A0J9EWM8_AJEDA|nr:hypothetical protein BDDG_13716 [Blastomyces dermatitidis ATCC 18188]
MKQSFAEYYAVAALLDLFYQVNIYTSQDWTEEKQDSYVKLAQDYYNVNYQRFEQADVQDVKTVKYNSLNLHTLITTENQIKLHAYKTEFDCYLQDNSMNLRTKSILEL